VSFDPPGMQKLIPESRKAAQAADWRNSAYCKDDSNRHWSQRNAGMRDFPKIEQNKSGFEDSIPSRHTRLNAESAESP
jgi:hypothetical protein